MTKIILVLLILVLGVLLAACGPTTGEVVPIKFEHTMSPAFAAWSAGAVPLTASFSSLLHPSLI